jgi:putative heme transporter
MTGRNSGEAPSDKREPADEQNPSVPISETATSVSEPQTAHHDETLDPADDATSRAKVRATMLRTIQVLVFFFVLIYLVLPKLEGLGVSIRRLRNVNLFLVLLGLALEIAALVSYSQLTREALFPQRPKLGTTLRIQLATKTVTNVVPGGSAAGSALGYRLLTLAGVEPTGAGFALATAGIGSAAVLNVLLWIALFVSIPLSGPNPVYVTTALVGVIVIALLFGIGVGLIRGVERAEQSLRRLSRHLSFIDAERIGLVLRRINARLRNLAADRTLVKQLVFWAAMNWLLDACSLWVFLRAFGLSFRPDAILVAFCVANISAAIPLTPGGIGVIDTILVSMLAVFGTRKEVTLAVAAYRLVAYWLPIPLGAGAYFTLRFGRWRLETATGLSRLRDEAGTAIATGESVFDWAERVTEDRVGSAAQAAQASGRVVIFADRAEPGTVRLPHAIRPPSTAPLPSPTFEEHDDPYLSTHIDDGPNESLAP